MKKIVTYFFKECNLSNQTVTFKRLLYLFLFIKIGYWLFYYDLFFGQSAIAYIKPYPLAISSKFAFLLSNQLSQNAGYFFILGLFGFLLLSYFVKQIPFVFEFICYLLVINIHNKIYPTLTGGDYLLNQFLFFNCFLAKSFAVNENWKSLTTVCLHNFSVVAILVQINLVYLLAAFAKLKDVDWIGGTAVIKLEMIDYFNLFSRPFSVNNFLGYFLTYLVLFYQLLFPILIWFKRAKTPLLLVGILMHLYIAFVTGLVGFAAIMLLGYVYFWPLKKISNFYYLCCMFTNEQLKDLNDRRVSTLR